MDEQTRKHLEKKEASEKRGKDKANVESMGIAMEAITSLLSLHTSFIGLMYQGGQVDVETTGFEALPQGKKSEFQATYLRLSGICDEARERIADTTHTVDFTADEVREVAATATKQLRELTAIVKE